MEEEIRKIRKRNKPVTVYSAVQGERSRPFQQQVNNYRANLREQFAKKPTTFSEKVGSKISRGLSLMQRGGVTRALYNQPVAPYGSNIRNMPSGRRTGRRGRPSGTVKYTDERGNPIGVYEYRKLLSARLRALRLQMQQQANISPEQQQIINRIEAQKRYAQMNKEQRVIPDTSGEVDLDSIFREINNASGMVD